LVTNYIEIRLYLSSILPVKSNNRWLYGTVNPHRS